MPSFFSFFTRKAAPAAIRARIKSKTDAFFMNVSVYLL
jgi:hypothetical protein